MSGLNPWLASVPEAEDPLRVASQRPGGAHAVMSAACNRGLPFYTRILAVRALTSLAASSPAVRQMAQEEALKPVTELLEQSADDSGRPARGPQAELMRKAHGNCCVLLSTLLQTSDAGQAKGGWSRAGAMDWRSPLLQLPADPGVSFAQKEDDDNQEPAQDQKQPRAQSTNAWRRAVRAATRNPKVAENRARRRARGARFKKWSGPVYVSHSSPALLAQQRQSEDGEDLPPEWATGEWQAGGGDASAFSFPSFMETNTQMEPEPTQTTTTKEYDEDGRPNTSSRHKATVGTFVNGEGQEHVVRARLGALPEPRQRVLWGGDQPRDVRVPLADRSDVNAVDKKLGYQMPRVWFPLPTPAATTQPVALPERRPPPLEAAQRRPGVQALLSEFGRTKATRDLDDIEQMGATARPHQLPPASYTATARHELQTDPATAEEERAALAAAREAGLEGPLRAATVWTPRKGRQTLVETPDGRVHLLSPARAHRLDADAAPASAARTSPTNMKVVSLDRLGGRPGDPQTRTPIRNAKLLDALSDAERASLDLDTGFRPRLTDDNYEPPPLVDIQGSMDEDLRRKAELDEGLRTDHLNRGELKQLRDEAAIETSAYRRLRLNSILEAEAEADVGALTAAVGERQSAVLDELADEHAAYAQSARDLRVTMGAQINEQWHGMPLRFLFETEGGAVYCRARLKVVFGRLVEEFERSQKTQALARLKQAVENYKFKQRNAEYMKMAGAIKLGQLLYRIAVRHLTRSTDRWVELVRTLIWQQRQAAVLPIQTLWRRVRDGRAMLRWHEECPIGGRLSDIDMGEFRDLPFIVPPKIREDKRRAWRAAIVLQTPLRKLVWRRWFVMQKAGAIVMQSSVRMWSVRAKYLRVRAATIEIQAGIRMYLQRCWFLVLRRAAVEIQRHIRGYLARTLVGAALLVERRALEERITAAPKVQRAFRAHLARRRRRALAERKALEHRSALTLQLAWYSFQDNYSMFVLLCCLRAADEVAMAERRRDHLLFRQAKARRIQREFRRFRGAKHALHATKIQTAFRHFLAVKTTQRVRQERMAERRLRHWCRVRMRKRHEASRRIAFLWFSCKPGRLRHHLRTQAAQRDAVREREWLERRNDAATMTQCLYRGVKLREWLRRELAAIAIQRISRGFVARRVVLDLLRDKCHVNAGLYMERIRREAMFKELARQRRQANQSARRIQAAWRGHVVRETYRHARARMRVEARALTVLQRAYRAYVRRRDALHAMYEQRRRVHNPYREAATVGEAVRAALAEAATRYDPFNAECGMELPQWLHRVGAAEVLPLFRARGVDSVAHVKRLSDNQLKRVGIDGAPSKAAPEGVFQGAQLRAVLLKLAEDDPDTLARFQPVEETAEHPVPRHAQLVREFLKVFDGYITRAKRFATAIGDVPVSRLQLARYFERFTSSSSAVDLENLQVLLTYDEHESQLARALERQVEAADSLQYGLERARDLFSPGFVRDEIVECIQRALSVTSHAWTPKEHVERFRDVTDRLLALDHYAALLVRVARGKLGRLLAQAARAQLLVARANAQYQDSLAADHVALAWQKQLEEDALEAERQRRAALEAARRAAAEEELRTIVRWGWTEYSEPAAGGDGVNTYFLGIEAVAVDGKTVLQERPVYVWEDWEAAIQLQRLARMVLGKAAARRERRYLDLNRELIEAQKRWKTLGAERDRHISVRFNIRSIPALRAFDVESDSDSDDDLGGSSSQLQGGSSQLNASGSGGGGGGDAKRRGGSSLLDSDDEDEESRGPKPQDGPEQLKLKMNVMALYGGYEQWYPGKIGAVETHKGLAGTTYTYTVVYEDGDVEANIARDKIKLTEQELARWKRLCVIRKKQRRAHRRKMHHRRERKVKAIASARSKFAEALTADWVVTPEGAVPDAHNVSLDHAKSGAALVTMMRSALAYAAETKPVVSVSLRLDYTKVQLPFGWQEYEERRGAFASKITYYNWQTGEQTAQRPSYTYEEDVAANMLCRATRVWLARRHFRAEILRQNLMQVVASAIKAGAAKAWCGYKDEGMSLSMWLNRLGLKHVTAHLKDLHARKKKKKEIPLGRFKAMDKTGLARLGIANPADRKQILGMVNRQVKIVQGTRFLNWFSGPEDTRSLQQVQADGRAVVTEMATEAYPNNPNRAQALADKALLGGEPLTYHQLRRFLRKYAGKPALAMDRVHELYGQSTVCSEEAEQRCYNELLNSCHRIVVLVGNMSLGRQRDFVSQCIRRAEEIAGTWRGFAKAALFLRTSVLEYFVDFSRYVVFVQARWRGWAQRKRYLAWLALRERAALCFQLAWKGMLARRAAGVLWKQRTADWEQLQDDQGLFYYFHKPSGSSSWTVPDAPYRPLVRDKFTQRLIQAWPEMDMPEEEEPEHQVGNCHVCGSEPATRVCHECPPPEDEPDSYKYFCFVCFGLAHQSRDTREHSSEVLGELDAPPLDCVQCGEPACRQCFGLMLDEDKVRAVFDQARANDRRRLDREEFKTLLITLGLHSSVRRSNIIFSACADATGERAVFGDIERKLREMLRKECDEAYCDGCYEDFHRKGTRARHRWTAFEPGAAVCVNCQGTVATHRCTVCDDPLCDACKELTHSKGALSKHKLDVLRAELPAGFEHCPECTVRVAQFPCDTCETSFCESCRACEHRRCPQAPEEDDGLDGPLTKCVECGKTANRQCEQCGDVYCSAMWMGNPGCFAKYHNKGNRRSHSWVPYTLLADAKDARRAERRAQRKLAKALAEKDAEFKAYRQKFEDRLQEQIRQEDEEFRREQEETLLATSKLARLQKLIAGDQGDWMDTLTVAPTEPEVTLSDKMAAAAEKANRITGKISEGASAGAVAALRGVSLAAKLARRAADKARGRAPRDDGTAGLDPDEAAALRKRNRRRSRHGHRHGHGHGHHRRRKRSKSHRRTSRPGSAASSAVVEDRAASDDGSERSAAWESDHGGSQSPASSKARSRSSSRASAVPPVPE